MFDRKTIDSWQNISILSFLINKTVIYTVKPVLSGPIWDKWPYMTGDLLKEVQFI